MRCSHLVGLPPSARLRPAAAAVSSVSSRCLEGVCSTLRPGWMLGSLRPLPSPPLPLGALWEELWPPPPPNPLTVPPPPNAVLPMVPVALPEPVLPWVPPNPVPVVPPGAPLLLPGGVPWGEPRGLPVPLPVPRGLPVAVAVAVPRGLPRGLTVLLLAPLATSAVARGEREAPALPPPALVLLAAVLEAVLVPPRGEPVGVLAALLPVTLLLLVLESPSRRFTMRV